MASKKKKTPAPKTAAHVSASDLLELEEEIKTHRENLADAVGRYNFALDAAKEKV